VPRPWALQVFQLLKLAVPVNHLHRDRTAKGRLLPNSRQYFYRISLNSLAATATITTLATA
jgi:hypothetical protein